MKALKRVCRLLSKYPKIMLVILVVGIIVRMVGPSCLVVSSDSNDVVNTDTISVNASGQYSDPARYGEWLDTGFSVNTIDRLSITTLGSIFLCQTENTTSNWVLSARSFDWINLGVSVIGGDGVNTGDILQITPGAPTPGRECNNSITTSDNMVRVSDSSRCYTNGELFVAAILPEGVSPTGNPSDVTRDYPGSVDTLVQGITNTNWGTSDSSSQYTAYGGYYGRVNKTGRVWIRIGDTEEARNNHGGYTGTISAQHTDGCSADNGMKSTTTGYTNYGDLQAVIAKDNPATHPSTPITLENGQFNPDDRAGYPPANGNIWLRVNDNIYTDNAGAYSVTIKATHSRSPKTVLSAVIMDLFITPVRNTLNKAVPVIFNKVVQETHFIKAVRQALTLYIMIYFVMFTVGLVQVSQMDLVIRVIKIGTVLTLISPNSWDFFNNYLFSMFTHGGMELLNNMTGAVGAQDNPFRFLDRTVGMFFRTDTITRMLAIAMTLPIGAVYVLLIIDAAIVYIIAVCRCIIGFMMSFIAVALLLTMAPFFISFILFNSTKELFSKWLSLLFRYTLEPVIMILGLVMINEILVIVLHGIINMNVCWKCAIGFSIPGYGNLFCLEFWMPWGYDNGGHGYDIMKTTTKLLTDILTFEVLTQLLKDYAEFAPRIAAKLTTTSPVMGTNFFGGSSVSGRAEAGLVETAKMPLGLDKKSIERKNKQKGIEAEATKRLTEESATAGDGAGDGATPTP